MLLEFLAMFYPFSIVHLLNRLDWLTFWRQSAIDVHSSACNSFFHPFIYYISYISHRDFLAVTFPQMLECPQTHIKVACLLLQMFYCISFKLHILQPGRRMHAFQDIEKFIFWFLLYILTSAPSVVRYPSVYH